MPSEKILAEKKQIVLDLTESLKSKSGVFVDYKGIKVTEDTEMRVKMRAADVDYTVIKNRLMKLAIKNVGYDELDPILVGTTSMAVSKEDPIAPARIIKEYADKLPNYFSIKAGFMDGKILSVEEVNAIASIPALPILQAQFLGTLLAPITTLAIVLKAAAEKGGASVDVEVKVETADEPVAEVKEEPVAEEKPAETTEVAGAAEEPAAVATEEPVAKEEPVAAEKPVEAAEAVEEPAAEVKEVTPATEETPAE